MGEPGAVRAVGPGVAQGMAQPPGLQGRVQVQPDQRDPGVDPEQELIQEAQELAQDLGPLRERGLDLRRVLQDAGELQGEPLELRSIRNALWSDVPAIAEGAARVLARCRESWAREAIEESFIDDGIKAELLK